MSSDTKKISDLTMRFINPETNKPAIYTFGQFIGDTSSPHHISLKQVRRLADDAKYLIKQGIHPLRERERLSLAQISRHERQD